jgi:hypothetical protein
MHVSGSNCIFNVESIWSSHGVPTQMMTNLSLHRLHIDSMWSLQVQVGECKVLVECVGSVKGSKLLYRNITNYLML